MPTNEEILQVLSKVIHPEKGQDIVSLNMISDIRFDDDGIRILLDSGGTNVPFFNSLRSSMVQVLKEAFGPYLKIASIELKQNPVPQEHKALFENLLPKVKNVILVASGKGGVGKTTVAVNLAIALAMEGYKTALLDADIFGPSVPKMLDAENFKPEVRSIDGKDKVVPLKKYGVKVLSTGFFVDPKDAVIWRGPLASSFLKQILEMGDWSDVDYMICDLPPGTSDIHLTMVQSLDVKGAIVVTTPQKVALADAVKGIAMFRSDKIEVPVLGIVENMSWFTPKELPDNKYYIFGKNGGKDLAESMNIPLLGQIPLVQGICESGDNGIPPVAGDELMSKPFLDLADRVIDRIEEINGCNVVKE